MRSRLMPALVAVLAVAVPVAPADGRSGGTRVQERSDPVTGARTFELRRPATHVAVHWRGARRAHVDVAFSRDGRRFGAPRHVELDEVGLRTRDGETYGEVMVAPRVRAVRVIADRRLRRVTVVGFTDRHRARAAGHVATSPVISRSGWGADESLRFDRRGREIWPPEFYDVQKLIVHHTAGENDDPDPPATIRAIYRYHAVNQGWGDIGYNFLVDEAGRVYEGRYSGVAGDKDPPVDSSPGEDDASNGVTGGHAYGYNSGTVGIALLGTLTSQDAASAARTTLEEFLAWEGERHALDPLAAGTYTNPVTGTSTHLPNILAHRDVGSTECPGEVFYGTLQELREATALRIQHGSAAKYSLTASPAEVSVARGKEAKVQVSLQGTGDFAGEVSLAADGLPGGASVDFVTPSLSPGQTTDATISTARSTSTGTYLLRIEGSYVDPATGLRDTRATTARVRITRR